MTSRQTNILVADNNLALTPVFTGTLEEIGIYELELFTELKGRPIKVVLPKETTYQGYLKKARYFQGLSQVMLKTTTLEYLVEYQVVSSKFTSVSNAYSFRYSCNQESIVFSTLDLSHVNFFMPRWSLAYKEDWSNFSKIFEPVYTDLKHELSFQKLVYTTPQVILADSDKEPVGNILYSPLLLKELDSKVIKNTYQKWENIQTNTNLNLVGSAILGWFIKPESHTPEVLVEITGECENYPSATRLVTTTPRIYTASQSIDNVTGIFEATRRLVTISNGCKEFYCDPLVAYANKEKEYYDAVDGFIVKLDRHSNIVSVIGKLPAGHSARYLDKGSRLFTQGPDGLYNTKLESKVSRHWSKHRSTNNNSVVSFQHITPTLISIYIDVKVFSEASVGSNTVISVEVDGIKKYLGVSQTFYDELVYYNANLSTLTLELDLEMDKLYTISVEDDVESLRFDACVCIESIQVGDKIVECEDVILASDLSLYAVSGEKLRKIHTKYKYATIIDGKVVEVEHGG